MAVAHPATPRVAVQWAGVRAPGCRGPGAPRGNRLLVADTCSPGPGAVARRAPRPSARPGPPIRCSSTSQAACARQPCGASSGILGVRYKSRPTSRGVLPLLRQVDAFRSRSSAWPTSGYSAWCGTRLGPRVRRHRRNLQLIGLTNPAGLGLKNPSHTCYSRWTRCLQCKPDALAPSSPEPARPRSRVGVHPLAAQACEGCRDVSGFAADRARSVALWASGLDGSRAERAPADPARSM